MNFLNALLDDAANNFGIFIFMFIFFMLLFTLTLIFERRQNHESFKNR